MSRPFVIGETGGGVLLFSLFACEYKRIYIFFSQLFNFKSFVFFKSYFKSMKGIYIFHFVKRHL